jgi:hypothetical protein
MNDESSIKAKINVLTIIYTVVQREIPDEGECCFEQGHTQDQDLVEAEK